MGYGTPKNPLVQEEGVVVGSYPIINFIGEGITAEADSTNGAIKVTVSPGQMNLKTSLADHEYSGILLTATAHENIAITDVCFMNSDGEWAIADADAEATTAGLVGMAVAAANVGASCTCLTIGLMRDDDGWGGALTKGAPYFLSTDAGDVTSTAPSGAADYIRVVGFGQAARVLFFNPSGDWFEHA